MTESNQVLRIEAREAELGGGVRVRRLLPNKSLRTVGAWCFLDQAGPAPQNLLSVGPHPHIGLQTFTWMIEGEILHRDSLGFEQVIRPGQINLMTSGDGISHVEEAQTSGAVHAAQLWIALPERKRFGGAAFAHYPELPKLTRGGWQITVLAGSFDGLESPVEVHTPLLGLDVRSERPARTALELRPDFEYAAVCLTGKAQVSGEALAPGTLLYLGAGRNTLQLETTVDGGAHVMLLGGEPLDEETLIWWNFVARTTEEVQVATEDWRAHSPRFGEVKGTELERLEAPDVPPHLRARKNAV